MTWASGEFIDCIGFREGDAASGTIADPHVQRDNIGRRRAKVKAESGNECAKDWNRRREAGSAS